MFSSQDFIERLSSAEPVPGGGSVAALETALAGSLLIMVANLTIGRKKYADVELEAGAILGDALRLRDRALALAEEDGLAFRQVADALTMPRATDDQKEERAAALQVALAGAAEPPLETMRCAASVGRLAARLVHIGNRSAVSDVGTAVLAARSAYHAARLNVEINVAGIRDPGTAAGLRTQMASIESPDRAEREVMALVESAIRGAGD